MISKEIMHVNSCTLNMSEQFLSGSCVYRHIWWHLDCEVWKVRGREKNHQFVCLNFCSEYSRQVFVSGRPAPSLLVTLCKQMCIFSEGFPVSGWISHRADSNEKKDNCVPSTAEPCSSCQHLMHSHTAAGLAVAKEVMVSKQKLGKKKHC